MSCHWQCVHYSLRTGCSLAFHPSPVCELRRARITNYDHEALAPSVLQVLAIQQSVSEEVDVAALLYVGIPAGGCSV